MEPTVSKKKTAYETLCDKLQKLAESEGRNMSENEIHRSARKLMGYVEFMLKKSTD